MGQPIKQRLRVHQDWSGDIPLKNLWGVQFQSRTGPSMTEDGNRKISKIFYSINTANPKSAVELIWDGTDNATAVLLSGQGFWDLRADGNEIANNATTPTGDVLLSTKNFAIGDNYTILVVFR